MPLILTSEPTEQAQQTVEDGNWVRRASRHVEIDLKNPLYAVAHLAMSAEDATRDRAGAGGDDEFWFGHRLVGAQGCLAHVLGDRPRDQHSVCMAGRGDKVDAEAARIEHHIAKRIYLGLTAIAAAGADLAQAQRAAQQAP